MDDLVSIATGTGGGNLYVAASSEADGAQLPGLSVITPNTDTYIGKDEMPTAGTLQYTRVEAALRVAAGRINESLQNGESVIVYCRRGRQRSVAVAAAYLMLYKGMGVLAALEKVRDFFIDETQSFFYYHRKEFIEKKIYS